MKALFSIVIFCYIGAASAADDGLLKDFDALGGNNILYQKAQALHPDKKIEIVQNRVVSRISRHEFGGEYANVVDGDSYLKARSLGVNYRYHLSPRWSFGVKYEYGFNELLDAGKRSIQTAIDTDNKEGGVPDIDWIKQRMMATVSFYPIYGKVNIFDMGIVHFDLYGLLGAGQVELRRGNSTTYTAGAGLGMWLSQHLTARVEIRYETFDTSRISGESYLKQTSVGSVQLGYML